MERLSSWVKEIIVIDNGSTDDTLKLANKYGAFVYSVTDANFSAIRQQGAALAKGEWLLYVDADETVTHSLQNEILEVITHAGGPSAFSIPRKNYYLRTLWPTSDSMIRLIKKSDLIRWEGVVHEHAIIRGKVGMLKHQFIHDTHRTLAEMVAKTNEWSVSEAKLRYEAHHPRISWWRFIRVMMTAFIHTFVFDGGWRAGTVGWIESIYQSFSIFITYAKLWEMQQKTY